MHPHRQRFLLYSTTLTGLGQLGRSGGDGDDLAVSACSRTGQDLYKRPGCAPLNTAAIAALPRPIRDFFQEERPPLVHDLMSGTPMQALAMGGLASLPVGEPCLGLALPLGCPPVLFALASLLHSAVWQVVLGVVDSALPVEVALLPPDLSRRHIQLSTEVLKPGRRIRDHGDGGRTEVQPHD